MMENFQEIKLKVMVNFFIKMETFMKDNEIIMLFLDMDRANLKMERDMKEILKIIKNMEMVNIIEPMIFLMMATEKIIKLMEMESLKKKNLLSLKVLYSNNLFDIK